MFSIGDVVKVRKRLFKHRFITQASSKLDGYYHGVIRAVGKSTYDVFFFYDKELVTIHKTNLALSSEDDYLSTSETKNYIEYKNNSTETEETPTTPQSSPIKTTRLNKLPSSAVKKRKSIEKLLQRAKENSRQYGFKLDPIDIALQNALEGRKTPNLPRAPVKKRKKKSVTWQSPVFRKLEPEFNECI